MSFQTHPKQTGLSISSIVSYENGLREPNSKAMAALERYFRVSGDYLRGNLSRETFFENSTKVQSNLDQTSALMFEFKEQFGYASQSKQSSATHLLNESLSLILNNILPDNVDETDVNEIITLLSRYFSLNKYGKNELLKRTEELIQLKQYLAEFPK